MQKISIIIKEVKEAAKYYIGNREVLKQDARNMYRNLSEKEKEMTKKYQRERYHVNTNLTEKLKPCQRN